MKNILSLLTISALLILASCSKISGNIEIEEPTQAEPEYGTLAIANGFSIKMDDGTDMTKAISEADGTYRIKVINSNTMEVVANMDYDTFKREASEGGHDGKLNLISGSYTLQVSSSTKDVPKADWECPVYGATKEFEIVAGQTTTIDSITCTLQQCVVAVNYNDAFKSLVTGDGATTVTVTAGYPLTYQLSYNNGTVSYESSRGYFAVNNGDNTTMEVVFRGSISGKSQRMSKTFTGIKPRQFRNITFMAEINEEGNATFDVVITDLVNDSDLGYDTGGSELVIGDDPNAPQGDGGIKLEFDYAGGCDATFTNFSNILIPNQTVPGTVNMCFKLIATVPNQVKYFTVEISSTAEAFEQAVGDINDGSTTLDLVNPSSGAQAVFTQILPFPYGDAVKDKSSINFDLSDAQTPLLSFPGTHKFIMHVTDKTGCKKDVELTMIVPDYKNQ